MSGVKLFSERGVGQDYPDQRGELAGVSGAHGDHDPRVGWEGIEHEVLIRRDGAQAGLCVQLRTGEPGDVAIQELAVPPLALRVWLERARLGGYLDHQSAGDGDDPLARGLLDLTPGLVGGRGERSALGLMLGQPDDPRMVLRAPSLMAQPELLDPEHPGPEPACPPASVAQPGPPHPITIAW
jgi:hypothetical protein